MIPSTPCAPGAGAGNVAAGFRQGAAEILDGLIAGARNMVSVAVACAAAGIIVGGVTLGVGGMITEIISSISGGNIFFMLVITAIASLLLGMGLPTTATYIVMASLTAPVIVHIAGAQGFFVPLIAAHLFCFYFGILADDTPPVGLAAYAAAAIAKSDPIKTGFQSFFYDIRAAILPFMFIFNTDILLYHINSWGMALVIFVMTCLGTFAFASLTQGYFIARNRWYEVPILLAICAIMFRPGFFAQVARLRRGKHWLYLMGIGLWGLLYLLQKPRGRNARWRSARRLMEARMIPPYSATDPLRHRPDGQRRPRLSPRHRPRPPLPGPDPSAPRPAGDRPAVVNYVSTVMGEDKLAELELAHKDEVTAQIRRRLTPSPRPSSPTVPKTWTGSAASRSHTAIPWPRSSRSPTATGPT